MKELTTKLAQTTYMDFNEAAELVNKGLLLGLSVEDMAQLDDWLPEAVQGAALGLSIKQLLVWKDRIGELVMVIRLCSIDPADVPDVPPARGERR